MIIDYIATLKLVIGGSLFCVSELFDDEVSVCVKVELLFRIKIVKGSSEIVGLLGVSEKVCVGQKGFIFSHAAQCW